MQLTQIFIDISFISSYARLGKVLYDSYSMCELRIELRRVLHRSVCWKFKSMFETDCEWLKKSFVTLKFRLWGLDLIIVAMSSSVVECRQCNQASTVLHFVAFAACAHLICDFCILCFLKLL